MKTIFLLASGFLFSFYTTDLNSDVNQFSNSALEGTKTIYIGINNKFVFDSDQVKVLAVTTDDQSRIELKDNYFVIKPPTPGKVKIHISTSKGITVLQYDKDYLPHDIKRSQALADTVYRFTLSHE